MKYMIVKKKEKLNFTICQNDDIYIENYVSINENKIIQYDSLSDYYNDICYVSTTDEGTDIVLKDRRNEFINNKMSLCEKNCVYKGYNLDQKTALCECKIKTVFHYISELIDNKDKLLNSFLDINTITNLYVLKCMNNFFSEEGFSKNIGSYILLIIISVNIFLFIIYIIKRKYYIQEMIDKNIKKDNQKKNNDNSAIKNLENKVINIQKKHQCHHNKKKRSKGRNSCIIKTNGDLSLKSNLKIEFNNFQKLVNSENKKVIEMTSDNNIEKYNKKKKIML